MPASRCFDPRIEPCPALPEVTDIVTAHVTRCLGGDRGPRFFEAALCYAQSLWREGKPAQAILQLNKAWSADLPQGPPPSEPWISPYRALLWFLRHAPPGSFLGNPVRHFQHLATRMSGPRVVPRTWRAWACFHLAEKSLAGWDFPRDEQQIQREGIVIPSWAQVVEVLRQTGWPQEAGELLGLARDLEIA